MRFGASSWAFTFPFESSRDASLVERMQALGCVHFELGGESVTEDGAIDTDDLRRRIQAAGMTASVCGIFTAERDLSSLDPEIRRAGMAYLRSCIEVAEGIGATVVVGAFCGVGGHHTPSADVRLARYALAAEELASAAPIAASAGVRLGAAWPTSATRVLSSSRRSTLGTRQSQRWLRSGARSPRPRTTSFGTVWPFFGD